MKTYSVIVCMSILLFSSCARVVIYDAKDGKLTKSGITYYEPKFYINIKKAIKDTVVYEIFQLPDYAKQKRIVIKPGLGSVSGSVKLSQGWQLTEFGQTSDSKIPETITALSGAVGTIGGLFEKGTKTLKDNILVHGNVEPGIYEIIFNHRTGSFEALKPIILY